MKRICINCGSNIGLGDNYKTEAKQLGKLLAEKNISVVYGGANVGLMGIIADAALLEGGEVIGVIPKSIEAKVGHKGLSKLFIVESMHDRKNMMFELSDAFIAFPGGFGTLEEIFELLTWQQLGLHNKPCGFLNINGYYNKLFDFIDYAVEHRFIKKEHSDMVIKANSIEIMLEQFSNFKVPFVEKWIK